mmetsp:Transcript_29474/g.43485  ORF Transcript_29474/g.43485 Transcript_29474/m.43485 type:complete len:252 (-) Transcript_29474:434-1189(-)
MGALRCILSIVMLLSSQFSSVVCFQSTITCQTLRHVRPCTKLKNGIFPPDDDGDWGSDKFGSDDLVTSLRDEFSKYRKINPKVAPMRYTEDQPEDLIGFWEIFWDGMPIPENDIENVLSLRADGQLGMGGPALGPRDPEAPWAGPPRPVGGAWHVQEAPERLASTMRVNFFLPPKREVQYIFEGEIFRNERTDLRTGQRIKVYRVVGSGKQTFKSGEPEVDLGSFDMKMTVQPEPIQFIETIGGAPRPPRR